ncbi:hypothetical protein KUM39_00600 [Streptomyces sp. J2-1]|uniref:hypothetical protein n=1 Tax=Streptomyces corallincola TaxID=2851888 RepID=UPI001C39002D|nr:hypothetical protein [Streptomyces corallincola]MBV2352868.1 hypothetical protein [Streptomyces corallincola]
MTTGRSLVELGLAEAPRDRPLSYPGVWPAGSGLLHGDRMLPLDRLTYPDRSPVLAVGSNASPGQLRHKFAEFGLTTPVPMVRVRVTGVDVGVSAHVSRMGYVSAAPVKSAGSARELFLIWLDPRQLEVIDASEGARLPEGNFRRVWVPSPGVCLELADGTLLPGAYVYVNRHGVLRDGDGAPRRHPGQLPLLTELLRRSAGLRELFGDTPEEFSARARADVTRCARGTRLFAELGWVTSSGLEEYAPGHPGGTGPGAELPPTEG